MCILCTVKLQISKLIIILIHIKCNLANIDFCRRYYFGVGGGTLSFINAFNENCTKALQSNQFTVEVKEVYEDGASNLREIISIRKSK